MQLWKNRTRRIAALACALALAVSLTPAAAFAEQTDSTAPQTPATTPAPTETPALLMQATSQAEDVQLSNNDVQLQAEGDVAKIGDKTYATLQDAIDDAQPGNTITLLADVKDAAVTITKDNLTLDLNGHTLSGVKHPGESDPDKVCPPAITIGSSSTTMGTMIERFTLQNGKVATGTGLHAYKELKNLVVSDVVFENNVALNDKQKESGAAVRFESDSDNVAGSSATFTNCKFLNNRTYYPDGGSPEGGAVAIYDVETVTFAECDFTGNKSEGFHSDGSANGKAGAVWATKCDTLTFTGCDFQQNYANSNSPGGAVGTQLNEALVFTDCTFTENTAASGGGAIGTYGEEVTLTGCTFTQNKGETSSGGAVQSVGTGSTKFTVTGCTFTQNTGKYAGAIVAQMMDVDISNTSFRENQSTYGGAMWLTTCSSVTIEDSPMEDNQSSGKAAAVAIESTNLVTITDSDFINNTSDSYGSLWLKKCPDVTVRGGRFEGNTTQSSAGVVMVQSSAVTMDAEMVNNQATSGVGGVFWVYGTASAPSSLTLSGTVTGNTAGTYGGAVYAQCATVDLSGADVYNNTAGTAADDICSDAKSTLTLGPVGDSWVLDDCSGVDSGAITGWYDDSANARWNAHDGDGAYHVQAVADFNGDAPATHTGTLCLKAAHNAYATLTPADITIYMGGNDGYDGVLSGTDATTSNSLPEPGFYFTLPQDLNQVLSDAMGVDPSAAIDLSGKVNVTAIAGGADRQWTLERYGTENGTSTAMVDADGVEHFIYRIVPADGQDPIRVAFTDTETGETITSDAFDPSNALYKQYEIRLYTGQVKVESISMQFTVPGADGAELTYSCGYDAAGSTPGTLTVRYASDSAAMTPAAVGEAGLQQAVAADAGSFHVQVADGQMFYLNETDHTAAGVTVAHSDVSLLADTLVSGENYAYVSALYEKALTKAGFARATVDSAYLDLVDADNGNAWLTPAQGETVTVFWPYRSGMDQNSELKLYHFEGLDRTMETADVANEIAGTEPAEVEITKGEYGITFTTDSFSPFVLVCDTSEPDTGDTGDTDDTDDTGDDGNNTSNTTRNQNMVTSTATGTATAAASAAIPQTGDDMPVGLLGGLAALAAGGLAALLALRKRRGV